MKKLLILIFGLAAGLAQAQYSVLIVPSGSGALGAATTNNVTNAVVQSGLLSSGQIGTNAMSAAAHGMYWKTNVSFQTTHTGAAQSISAGVEATIAYNSINYDYGGGFNATSNTFTAVIGGNYYFYAGLYLSGGAALNYM